jgi:hypothetical protein
MISWIRKLIKTNRLKNNNAELASAEKQKYSNYSEKSMKTSIGYEYLITDRNGRGCWICSLFL